jgi:4-aminobutyrate aminotransferase-like enzyme/Ser/Thr protein kinase RdoA (MazF antagonist)
MPTRLDVLQAPHFTNAEAVRIAHEIYDLTVTAAQLPSERDQNFLLENSSGDKFVLKIANSEEALDVLHLQHRVVEWLASRCQNLVLPHVIRSKGGEDVARLKSPRHEQYFVRLLTWVAGTPLANAQPHNNGLLRSLGTALAEIDAALASFCHSAANRVIRWDLRHADMARFYTALLPESRRSTVEAIFAQWSKIDWRSLRSSIIHNDANDYNILVVGAGTAEQRVSAIVDFGDVVHTATVCDLAIALAYIMLGKAEPIEAAGQVLAAYHEKYPLTEAEIDVLYTLAVTRLCCSVCYAEWQSRQAPENEYLKISNAPAWALLEKLSTLPFDSPRGVLRYSCGLPMAKNIFPYRGRHRDDLIAARKNHLGPSLSISYESPLHIVCGSRQYLYDADGRRYLDCVNNVAHVGHSHPRVVRAASDQMAVLNTNTRYLDENLVEYVERLTATLPEQLSVVYLVCSGSEANELALRLARVQTGREGVIVLDSAYHGNTNSMVDISPYKFDGPGGRGCPAYVYKIPMPDIYRGAYRGPDAGARYATHVADAARLSDGLAAFFFESALSCGGQIILPPGFLHEAFAAVRSAGGVCVADEIQTGLGRAGTHFWMFETQGVVPDVVTIGKPLGNGHPLAAVVTTSEIADSFANGMEYFNTFGGSPVSCAVGLAVLDVIRDEELQHNAFEVGEYLKRSLRELQDKHPLIGDVRGIGLFLGVELVRDRATLEPADREATALVERMKERGVLLSIDGPFHNVIKFKPPLVFSLTDADFVLSELDAVLTDGFTTTAT